MILSYQHKRMSYYNIEDNQWINIVQYYRSLLRANAVHLPSPVSFVPGIFNAGYTNKNIFKSKYAAGIIGKFVYVSLRYIRVCSYLLKLLNKVKKLSSFNKHKIVYKKIYNKRNVLIYFRKIKHILLFFKEKYMKQIKKQKRILWNEFFQVPESFWSYKITRKIKSIIWKIFDKKIIIKRGIKKEIYLRRKFFFLNYDRISNFIYKNINKKKLPKKQWFLLKKKKKKIKSIKRKYTSYIWFKFIKQNIKERRKYNYLNLNPFNSYSNINSINNIHFQLNGNISKELAANELNNIKLLYKYLPAFNYSKKINIFLKNYCYYLYFRLFYSKYKRSITKNNKSIYLKLFYKYLSNVIKKKNDLNEYIKTGVVMNLYDFSKFNYSKSYIRLIGWFDKFFMERDLNYYFVFNSLFKFKEKLINNISIYYLNNDNLKNNIYFFYSRKKISDNMILNNLNKKSIILTKLFQSFNINKVELKKKINNKKEIIKHIESIKNTHILKERSWIRLCYYPYLYNYKWIFQEDDKTHLIYQKLNKYYDLEIKKNFWNNFIKNKMKQEILKNINKSIKKNEFLINKNKRKNKLYKLKYIKLRDRISDLYFINHKFLKEDQYLLNKQLNIYFKKLYNNKKFKDYNRFFFKLKFKKEILIKKNLFINKKSNKKIFKKHINNQIFFYYLRKINKEINNKIKINKYYLNNFFTFKNVKKLKNKKINKNIKFVNLFINKERYNYYKLKNKKYFVSLWNIRKELLNKKLNKKINNEYRNNKYNKFNKNNIEFKNELVNINKSRFIEKRKLINRSYFFNSLINKELFLEYSRRLHSKDKINEYERSFLKVGPLSFYHVKTQNIGNINNGIYLSSNILFISNHFYNSYPKPFFNLLYWTTKLFTISFFSSLKEIFIDQYNDILKTNNKKQTLYYFYKQWNIKL